MPPMASRPRKSAHLVDPRDRTLIELKSRFEREGESPIFPVWIDKCNPGTFGNAFCFIPASHRMPMEETL